LRLTHTIVASLAGAALLVGLVVVLSFWAFGQIEEAGEAREHTSVVVSRAEDLLSALKDAETGQRGYSLTGDEAFLEPYLMVRDSVTGHLEELRRLTSTGAAEKHLDALVPLMAAKLAEMSHVIDLRRNHDVSAVLAAVASGRGKRLMDSIRAEVSSFIQIEEGVLAQHEADFQSNMRHLFAIIVTASLLTLLFALSFAYLIYRESQHRLENLVHLKTQHLLEMQEETNQQLQQANVTLQISEEKLRLFADNIPAMTVSWDENLRCRFANKAFAELFGLTVENILGKHVREVVGEEVYHEIEGHFVQVLQGHPVIYERARKLQNGESRYLEIKLLPHLGDQGKVLGAFAVTTDITEHKLMEERIQRVAHHDSLTGLPNRLLFNDRLTQAMSRGKRTSRQFALLYLDLDKFKPVNDTLGHTAGDELLQAVAARLQREVRESDTVARVGGDEFTVILPDIAQREEAETVAKKIIAALAAPFQLGSRKQRINIGTSIGIALYPADARDADALVKAADAAMYSAKTRGGCVRFFEI
jgi:diguanylate cyclase (GGDEF)-like protein/PAS domain S-box-containing protein